MGTEAQKPEIVIPVEWSNAANSIDYGSPTSPPPIVLICGAKNAGKTTFSRYLVNTFLSRYKKVAYLDTDVGQTEFTPPGFVSLTLLDRKTEDLTVPCLKTPQRSFFFGDISSKGNPKRYLKYIYALYHYYTVEYRSFDMRDNPARTELPLVINTSGWVKGFGYSLLVDMVKKIAPTHVVKIRVHSSSSDLPDGAFWVDGECSGTTNLIEIYTATTASFHKSVRKDARHLRELRIVSYFRTCIPSHANISTIKELATALASHPPYEISLSSITIEHLHCKVPSYEIFYSLNATIVGLAISSEDSELPLSVGLGIIRGIDTYRNLLYVITPVPYITLEKVDLILQGFVQIPDSLLQADDFRSPYMSASALAAQRVSSLSLP